MTVRPTGRVQPLRKIIHLGGAVFPLLYLFLPRLTMVWVALLALAAVVAVEGGRQICAPLARIFARLIGPAMRPGEERKPTAGTWSMLAIVVTVLIFRRAFAIPAMFYAHLGDPAAEIVGRRWGRRRIRNGKSLEGSLGCLAVSVAAGLACTQALPLDAGVAVLGALVATAAEAAPLPLGDNLLMAPLSALAMALAASVF